MPDRSERSPFPEGLLAREGRALRGLARALTADAHAAEDLVQDAWVAALQRPRSAPSNAPLSAWLRGALRNLARVRSRTEARRRAREEDRAAGALDAGPHGSGTVPDGLARAETLQAVTQAVVELTEPYRSTVLARWYEGLEPREIAARDGVPVATVKSRLVRAHARLRTALDEAFEQRGPEADGARPSWRRALLPFAGLPVAPPLAPLSESAPAPGPATATPTLHPPTPPLPLTAAGSAGGPLAFATLLAMTLKTPLVAAGLLVAALALPWWLPDDAPLEPVVVSHAPSAREDATLLVPQNEEAERTAAELEQAPAAPPDLRGWDETTIEIAGRVRDPDDLPLGGARVLLAPADGSLHELATTDAAGRFAVQVRVRSSQLETLVAVSHPTNGLRSELLPFTLRQGERNWIDLGLGLAGNLAPDRSFDMAWPLARDLEGHARFRAEGFPESCGGLSATPIAVPIHLSFDLDSMELSQGSGWILPLVGAGHGPVVLDMEEGPPPAFVEGQVLGPDGAPAANVAVAAGTDADDPEWPGEILERTRTDAEGRYRLGPLPPGHHHLVAGSPGAGRAGQALVCPEGAELHWSPQLQPERSLHGRLVDADGGPLASWIVEGLVARRGRLEGTGVVTDATGAFRLTSLPGGPLSLFARGPDQAGLATLMLAGVGPGGDLGALVVGEPERLRSGFTLQGLDSEGQPARDLSVRALDLETGRALTVPRDGQSLIHEVDALPPALLDLVLLGSAGDVERLERVRVDGLQSFDLGTHLRPDPARLHVVDRRAPGAAATEDERLELLQERAGYVALAKAPEAGAAHDQPLASGTYLARWGTEAAFERLRFELEAGESVRLVRDADGLRVERSLDERALQRALAIPGCQSCHAGAISTGGTEARAEGPSASTALNKANPGE